MKNLLMLSSIALIVSSSLTIAAVNKVEHNGFASFDSNKNGEINQSEAKGKLAKRFDKVDVDANGLISKAEFDAAKPPHKGKQWKKPEFAQVDKNKDGAITKDEVKGRLAKYFDKVDSNDDGSISEAEFVKIKERHKSKGHKKAKFKKMDSNGNGVISKGEAKGRLAKNFDNIDADNNGYITKQELKAASKMHQGKGDPTVNVEKL